MPNTIKIYSKSGSFIDGGDIGVTLGPLMIDHRGNLCDRIDFDSIQIQLALCDSPARR